MRVLVLGTTLGVAGGIERYTEALLRALGEIVGERNVSLVAVPGPPAVGPIPWSLKLRFGGQAIAAGLRSRPDLMICTHLAVAPVGWLLARITLRPYWIVVYGIEAWCRLPFVKRVALQCAQRVLAISDFSRRLVLDRQGLEPTRVARIPCAFDGTLLRLEAGARPCHFIQDGRRVILSVGRLDASERYKGHDVVLQALPEVMQRFPDITYLVVGGGDDRPRLERFAWELGVANHVVFAGGVNDQELAACYRASEVFVLPAKTVLDERAPKGEGFGIVYLEAMGFGKPVVGPSSGAPPEIIRSGEHGLLVDPEDPGAVARALAELLADRDRARRMGEAARCWVKSQYSYDVFRERWREELRRIGAAKEEHVER